MIVFIFYILFSNINSDNYYVEINTINFSINIPQNNNIIEDFNKLFPLSKILIDNENKGYYKLGSSTNQFSNFTNSTLKKGDLVLLEDNSYAFFYNPPSITINHIYIGYIVGYNLLLSNTNTVYSYWFIDNQMNINNSSCINASRLYGYDVKIDFGCDDDGHNCNKSSYFSIFVKGNYQLSYMPSVYLNETYFSNRCEFQDRNNSLTCLIKPEYYPGKLNHEHDFYKMEVREYINGCEKLVNIGMNVFLNNFYIIYEKFLILFFLLLL